MDPSLIRRKSATTSGLELINIHGYSLPKSELYQFSPLSGEFVYLVGSLVVVYDTVNHIQKEYLQNPKGLPYSCIEFSQDGSEMYTGELLSKEASVRFYTQSKFGKYISKTNMTTGFRTIDGIAVSPNKTFIAIHGTVRNSDKRDLKKLEIFDLNKKTSLQIHGISYKIKQFFFSKDESIYFITKDAIYQCLQKNKWSPNLKLSFSGKGRTWIDMADHEDKILIILDNSNLIVYDKKRSDFDTLELNYKEAPHCMTKFNDKLIVGWSNGVIYYSSLANLTSPRELPKPPYLGEGAVDIPEKIEYSDCKVVKASNSWIAAMFYDKTMVFYNVSESGGVEINKVIRTHCGSIFDIDCYPQAESPSHFWFVSGSIDKTLRRFIVYVNPKTGICQVNQDSMGLLWENLEHLKCK